MKTEQNKSNSISARQFFAAKMVCTTGPVEVSRQIEGEDEINILEVRAVEDYKRGHVLGVHNLPQENWSDVIVLHRDRVNILGCSSAACHLAAKAALQFSEKTFPSWKWTAAMKPERERSHGRKTGNCYGQV